MQRHREVGRVRGIPRRGRLVATATAAALALAACGSSTGGDETPKAGREAFKGTDLKVLLKEGYEIQAIQKYVPEFEKATGVNVDIEVYDEATARQKLVLDSTSKTGTYDVTSASFWNLPEYVAAGWLQPLDEYMSTAKDAWLHPEDLPKGAVASMTVQNKLYALPHTIIGGMMFYRKDVFDKLGLQAPKTTQDVLDAAKVVKQKRPDLIPFSGRGAPNFATLGTELGWAYGYGSILFDKQNQPHADSPEMKRAMNDYVTLMQDYGPSDAATLTFTQAGEKFSSGQAAMMFDTSGFGTIFEDPKQSKVVGKVGYSLPSGPAGKPLQWLYNEGLAVTAASKNKNAAWLFLQWRLSRETTTKELTELGRTDVPSLHVLRSPEYATYAKEHNVQDFTKMLPQSWEKATAEHWPFYPQFAKIGDSFAQQISAAIAGSQTVDAALAKAQQELTGIMKDAGGPAK
jgi:ABC-type glycerol-3-phosphate transport system substrate-binding protein